MFNNDNPNFVFNDCLCVCNIKKYSSPHWNSTCYYKSNTTNKNVSWYRIILYKYSDLTLYIEKNGQLNIFCDILDDIKYDIMNINISKNIDCPEKLKREISNSLTNQNIITEINQFLKDNNSSTHFETDDNYNLETFTNLYDDLIKNKLLPLDKKLDDYVYTDCLEPKGSTETKYNKLMCEKYPDKYINLDIKLANRCEIADIFDRVNNLLFHNKKIKT